LGAKLSFLTKTLSPVKPHVLLIMVASGKPGKLKHNRRKSTKTQYDIQKYMYIAGIISIVDLHSFCICAVQGEKINQ